MSKALVLMKSKEPTRYSEYDCQPWFIASNMQEIEAKIAKIAAANTIYEMVRLSDSTWRLGPDYDEGFFGNQPLYFSVRECNISDSITVSSYGCDK